MNKRQQGLDKVKVLITRQEKFSAGLIQRLTALGADCFSLPLFAIETKLDAKKIANINQTLGCCKLAIMISRNAAEVLVPHLARDLLLSLRWASIGPASAQYLQASGIRQVICPSKGPFDSLALIQALKRKNIELLNQSIALIGGEDGNTTLIQELDNLGANTKVMTVYKRVLPQGVEQKVDQLFNLDAQLDIIVISCVTSLQNLVLLTKNIGSSVLAKPLLVVSDRIHRQAIDMGFLNVYTAKGMSDEAIVAGLIYWRALK
jgi:uroporphyrinogen-III synthase